MFSPTPPFCANGRTSECSERDLLRVTNHGSIAHGGHVSTKMRGSAICSISQYPQLSPSLLSLSRTFPPNGSFKQLRTFSITPTSLPSSIHSLVWFSLATSKASLSLRICRTGFQRSGRGGSAHIYKIFTPISSISLSPPSFATTIAIILFRVCYQSISALPSDTFSSIAMDREGKGWIWR